MTMSKVAQQTVAQTAPGDQGNALIAMIDYISAEAGKISPLAAHLLGLAALEIKERSGVVRGA